MHLAYACLSRHPDAGVALPLPAGCWNGHLQRRAEPRVPVHGREEDGKRQTRVLFCLVVQRHASLTFSAFHPTSTFFVSGKKATEARR
jgi:hypothetical protein